MKSSILFSIVIAKIPSSKMSFADFASTCGDTEQICCVKDEEEEFERVDRMQRVNIRFVNADQVQSFVNVLNRMDVDFRLGSGCRIVNAKSIMGVFSLDLSQPQSLCYNSADFEIYEKLKPFLA